MTNDHLSYQIYENMSMRNSKTKTFMLFLLFGQFLHHIQTHLQKQRQRGMECYEFCRLVFFTFSSKLSKE